MIWKEIVYKIERYSWYTKSKQKKYSKLLLKQIYPFFDALKEKGLVRNYHFLNHGYKKGIDIRIELYGKDCLKATRETARKFNLSPRLRFYQGDEENTLKILTHCTEVVRGTLIKFNKELKEPQDIDDPQTELGRYYRRFEHYQINMLGANMKDEYHYHIDPTLKIMSRHYNCLNDSVTRETKSFVASAKKTKKKKRKKK